MFRYISLLTNVLEWQKQQEPNFDDAENNNNNNTVSLIKKEFTAGISDKIPEMDDTKSTNINKNRFNAIKGCETKPNLSQSKFIRANHLLMIVPNASHTEQHKNLNSAENQRIKMEILDDGFNQLVATEYSSLESSRRVLIDAKALRTPSKDSVAMRIECSNLYKTNLLSVHIDNGNVLNNSICQGSVEAQGRTQNGDTINNMNVSSYIGNKVIHPTIAIHPFSSYSDEAKAVIPPRPTKSKKKSTNNGRSTEDRRKK